MSKLFKLSQNWLSIKLALAAFSGMLIGGMKGESVGQPNVYEFEQPHQQREEPEESRKQTGAVRAVNFAPTGETPSAATALVDFRVTPLAPPSPQKREKLEEEEEVQEKLVGERKAEPPTSREEALAYANDLAAGLQVADKKGEIKYGSGTYRQVQTAMRSLRQGSNLEEAVRQSQIELTTLQQLKAWGESRPGRGTALQSQQEGQRSRSGRVALKQAAAEETAEEQSRRYAREIVVGLQVADRKGQLKYGSQSYYQVQTAIKTLRQGKSLELAARQAQVPMTLLEQLRTWGGTRPTSRIYLFQ